jgi:ribosomal protein S4
MQYINELNLYGIGLFEVKTKKNEKKMKKKHQRKRRKRSDFGKQLEEKFLNG